MTAKDSTDTVELWRRGSGDALLYLHGLADIHALPPERGARFIEELSAAFDVVAPAHPGYAGTPQLPPHADVEDYVFHYVDLLDRLELARVHVVGHSLGGWLAAELAIRRPDRVGALVLISPLGLHVAGAQPALFFGAAAPRGVGGFGELRAVLFADSESDMARASLPDDMSRDDQLRWFGGLTGAARLGWKAPQLTNPKLSRHLWRVQSPALLVVGDMDRLVSSEHVEAWRSGLTNATVAVVPGAGHSLPLEQPHDLSDQVVQYVNNEARVLPGIGLV